MERLEIQERKGGIMDCWMSMPENMIMGVMTAGTARMKQRADEQGGKEEGRRMGQTRTAFERSELHRCEGREEGRGGPGGRTQREADEGVGREGREEEAHGHRRLIWGKENADEGLAI